MLHKLTSFRCLLNFVCLCVIYKISDRNHAAGFVIDKPIRAESRPATVNFYQIISVDQSLPCFSGVVFAGESITGVRTYEFVNIKYLWYGD